MTKYIQHILENDPSDYKCDEQFCLGFSKGYLEGHKDAKPKWYNMSSDKPYDIIGWTKYKNIPTYGETWNPDYTTSYFVSTGDLIAITPKFLVYNAANDFFYVDYMKKFDKDTFVNRSSLWILDELEGLENSENLWWTELPGIPIAEIQDTKNDNEKQFSTNGDECLNDDVGSLTCEGNS